MKHKKIGLAFISIVIISMFIGSIVNADSDDPIGDLEPVIYEKLKFKQNIDYLHDDGKAEMKNTIPVKQFDINFDGSKQLPQRGDTSFVFLKSERGTTSTVAAKTLEIGLFSKVTNNEKTNIPIKTKSQQTTGNTTRTIIFIVMIVLGMTFMFTMLLPKYNQPRAVRRSNQIDEVKK